MLSSTTRADGIAIVALLVAAPAKVAVATVTSAAVGTVTFQFVAVTIAFICMIRLLAVTPLATLVCTEDADITPVSTSSTKVTVAARRAAELETYTPERYDTAPAVGVHQVVVTVLA